MSAVAPLTHPAPREPCPPLTAMTSTSPVRGKETPKSRVVAKGFSVKDILDLPSSKSSSSSLPRSHSSRPDPGLDSDPGLPGSYHSSVYYCPDPATYPHRWLPPAGDLFSYSNTFCKSAVLSSRA